MLKTEEKITWEEKTELVRLLNQYDRDPAVFWKRCMELLPKFDDQMFDMWITGIDLTEFDKFQENFTQVYRAYLPHQDTLGWRSEIRYGIIKQMLKEKYYEEES